MEKEEVFIITTWNSCLDHPDSVVIRDERQAWNFYEQEVNAKVDYYISLWGFQPKNEIRKNEKKTTHIWFEKNYGTSCNAFYTPDAFVSIQKTKI